MRCYEQEKHESRLDHSPPPQENIGIARKRQRGLQDPPNFVLENVPLPGIKSSGSYRLNPLASPFDVGPVKVNTQPNLPVCETDTNLLALEPIFTYRRSKSERNLALDTVFLDRFSQSEVNKEVEVIGEKTSESTTGSLFAEVKSAAGGNMQDIKTEDMDDNFFQFAPEVEEPEEIQLGSNSIKTEPLAEELGVLRFGTATTERIHKSKISGSMAKLENPGFKQVPDVVLSRYPRMAKYLALLATQEDYTKQIVSDPLVFLSTVLPNEPFKEKEEVKTPTREEGPVEFVLHSKQTSTAIFKKKPEPCSKITTLTTHQQVSPKAECIKPGYKPEEVLEAICASGVERHYVPSVQKDAVLPIEELPTPSLEVSMEVATHGGKLSGTVKSLPEKKLEQSFSARPVLPERYAIPIKAQFNEALIPKDLARVHGDRKGDERISQQADKDPLMEQLVMIDKRFSRNPEDICHTNSISRHSSVSSGASMSFSLGSGSPAAASEASRYMGETDPRDLDRLRRSMNPSPSPRRAHKSLAPEVKNIHPVNFEKGKNQTVDQENMAGNWLEALSISAKNASLDLPRGQPSILARIHGSICDDDEGDSDGVSPGEWVKPVELVKKKKSTKPKIGNTAQPGSPIFLPASGSVLEPAKGSVAGSIRHGQRSKVLGKPSYPHPKIPQSTTLQGSVSIDHSTLGTQARVGAEEIKEATIEQTKKEAMVMEWCEKGIKEMGIVNEKTRVGLRRPFVEDDWQRKSESEQPRGGWRAPREGGLFASPPSSVYGTSPLLPKNKTRAVSGRSYGRSARGSSSRGGSGSVLPHPVRQPQNQQVVNSIKDVADVLRIIKIQNEMPKSGTIISPVQGVTDQSPLDLHVSLAPPISHAQIALTTNLGVILEKSSEAKQPLFGAYVRKLCPLFSAGACHRGQSCSDLHPNYDEQSGTYNDKRFATEEAFNKEATMKAMLDKERAKALEELIRESREDADRKCRGTQLGAKFKSGRPRPINLQVGSVVVGRNAKGERDWTVEPPKMPELTEEKSELGSEHTKPKKQGKRRVQT